MLDRRANSKQKPLPALTPQRRETMLLAKEAFKHMLLKYCQREMRDGRSFCLSGLKILEFDQISKTSPQASEQLSRLVRDVCLRNIRDKDRLCQMDSGNFLLLLPDTEAIEAKATLDRLSGVLAGVKTHYHKQALRASTVFDIAHSKALGANLEALLAKVGYKLDESGNVALADLLKTESGEFQLSTIQFESWLSRYTDIIIEDEQEVNSLKVSSFRAVDTWSSAKVIIKTITQPNKPFSSAEMESLSKRAKTLTQVNHPGLVKTTDFQIEKRSTLWLCQNETKQKTLKQYLDVSQPGYDEIMELLLQACNIIIYLQSMIPPIVPPAFSLDNLLISDDKQLLLTNFEFAYLFPSLNGGEPAEANTDTRYQPVVASLSKLALLLKNPSDQVKKLLASLKEPLPKNLDTAYKARAAFKQIYDREKFLPHLGTEK